MTPRNTLARSSLTNKRGLAILQIAVLLLALLVPYRLQAAQLENRSLTLSTAAAGATGVDYAFSFDAATTSNVGSFLFEICSNDPFPGTSCTAPSGFDGTGATATSSIGTVNTVNTSGTNDNEIEVLLSTPVSVTALDTLNVTLEGLTNPSSSNTEYWVRVYTYSDTSTTTEVDSGGIAFSTGRTIDVTARVQETLSFCVYTGTDCNDGGSDVDLGILNTANTETALSYFDVATNARNGLVVTYNGTTLESGGYEIDPFGAGLNAPVTGTEQFGLRVSAVTTGGQNGSVAAPFNPSLTQYSFIENSTEDIATANGPIAETKYTIEYAANVAPLTPTGVYNTSVEYIATATF